VGWGKVATTGKFIAWQTLYKIIFRSSIYLLHIFLESKNYRIVDNNNIFVEGSTIYMNLIYNNNSNIKHIEAIKIKISMSVLDS
jgi:hypothetical protein